MGRKDMAAKVLMRRRREFADAFNVLFRRAGLAVDAESLMEDLKTKGVYEVPP